MKFIKESECGKVVFNIDTRNISNDLKKTKIYKSWYDMLYRCYSEHLHMRFPTYIGCQVCEDWHDFYNFYKWYQNNYYEVIINGKQSKMDLDKNVLVKGNKIYSPNTCCFMPHEINTMFINGKKNRGDYPLGVWYDSHKKKYRSNLCSKKLGTFNTVEQAFEAYKREKEKQIKELARKYKKQIPDKLYQAMVHWKVEITD